MASTDTNRPACRRAAGRPRPVFRPAHRPPARPAVGSGPAPVSSHPRPRPVSGRRVAALALAMAMATACRAGVPGPPAAATPPAWSPPAARPAPGGDPSSQDTPSQRAGVLAAYDRFWTVASTMDKQPAGRWPTLLATVAADPLLSQLLTALAGQDADGTRQYGLPTLRPTLLSLTADGHASVLDCQDATTTGLLDPTGLPATTGSAHTPVAATLTRDQHGTWRVTQARYLPGSC